MLGSVAENLGVVPIVVNAGAVLLPAVAAALAGFVGLLLRPRELVGVCRRNPWRVLMVVGAGVGLWLGVAYWTKATPAKAITTGEMDWAQVALTILQREQAGTLGGSAETMNGAATRPTEAVGYRQDARRCGYAGGIVPQGLRPLWNYRVGEAMVLVSPVVVGDRVYGASCLADATGNYGTLFCIGAGDGRMIWQTDRLGGQDLKGIFSSPAATADGRYLVIGQGLHDDADCDLLCVEAATGKLHWQVRTPLHLESSPAIRGDLVVIGAGAIEDRQHRAKGDPGFVLGVRISDGQVLFREAVNDPESSPAISAEGIVYIGSGINGKAVVALRSDSAETLRATRKSRVLWRTPLAYPVTGAVTLDGGLVIVGAGKGDYVYRDPDPAGLVAALDARTGRVVWQTELPDAVLGAVAACGDRLYCPVRNGEIVALNLADGRVRWRQKISGSAGVLAGPAVAGGLVYAVSKDGLLAVLAAEDGRIIEKHRINDDSRIGEMGMSLSSPTMSGGRVYVGSETGGLRCLIGTGSQP